MKIFKTTQELQNFIQNYKTQNPTNKIGLVPTMGSLHNGHLSLMQKCKNECDLSVVSIFVNPTQFGENEDFSRYPRKEEADLSVCEKCGVDIVFMPSVAEMYPLDSNLQTKLKAPKAMADLLEGAARPGHFSGVLQVVLKLFNLTQPQRAYFGQKDAQQLLIIKKMVQDLFLPIEIIPCPIIRTQEGLALSSRNAYLSKEGKKEALKISSALNEVSRHIMQGEADSSKLKQAGCRILSDLEVEYFEILNLDLQKIEKIKKDSTLILIVVKIEGVRLLDNLWI